MSTSDLLPRLPGSPTGRTLVAAVLGACALASGVALTATSGWLIVRASERPAVLTLLTAIVAVRAFGLARPAFRYWERLRSHDSALDDLARARTGLYAALIPLTPARLPRRGRAAMLAAVVDDLANGVEAQVRVSVPFVATGLAAVGTAVLCAAIEPWAGVSVAALVAVAVLTTAAAWRRETHGLARLTRARAETTQLSELVATNATALQAIGAQDDVLARLRRAHAEVDTAVRKQSQGRALAAGAIPSATALATLASALVAAGGRHTAPVTALLVLAPQALAEAFAALPDAARALASAQGSGRRLAELLDLTPAVDDGGIRPICSDRPAPHLCLRGVTASWDGSRTALNAVDADIAPGAVVAVTGPSGCGKSTLLAVLARHLDTCDGSYTVDGVEARSVPLRALRRLVAVVDDEPHVLATTVRENLRLARPGASDHETRQALDAAGLAAWLLALPLGLDTRLGSGGRGLSGGERTRLAIARALLSGRPVLLLDEPAAHLDHETAVAVLDDLVRARAGRTVVIVSHRPEALVHADGIMDLTRPVVVAPGR